MRAPRSLAPLRNRNYALYWVGFATSNTGKWIEQTGAVWLVYELTQSPVLLGLLGIARAVPVIVLSPIAGVIIDRVDQRRLLFATQAIALVLSFGLGVLIATGRVELWHVYVQVTLQAIVTAFDWSVRQALFPRLVPRSQLSEVVTLQSTAARSSALIGPAIGGIAIARFGEAAPFLLNSATFLVLMTAVVWIRGLLHIDVAGSSLRADLLEGIRHIRETPVLNGLLKMELLFSVFQLNPVIITIVGREVLDAGPEELGGLLSATALGAVVGIVCLLTTGPSRRQGRFIILSTFAYAASLVGFAVSGLYVVSFAMLAVNGIFDVFLAVTRNSVVQLAAPARMRGRLMANLGTVTRGLGPLAQTQSGLVAGAIGAPAAVVAAAAAVAVAAGIIARTTPAVWAFSSDEADQMAIDPAPSPPALQDA